ncbi:MAG: superoxide dismutase family protein [Acidobacteria bacterium]|nr:superoxide dismutase family protein [Acidobacteriota bacterium]
MKRKIIGTVILLSLSIALLALSPQQYDTDRQMEELEAFLPNDEEGGKMLIMTYCTICHSAAHIKSTVVTKAGSDKDTWMNLIDRMIGIRSAPIPPEEVEPLAAYLTKYFGPPSSPKPGTNLTASAKLTSSGGGTAKGSATFQQIGGQVQVKVEATGLSNGKYVVSLQENGDCSRIDRVERRIMDFGNREADASGEIRLELDTAAITVVDGPQAVVGRVVIVSAADAGTAVACGVVETLKQD